MSKSLFLLCISLLISGNAICGPVPQQDPVVVKIDDKTIAVTKTDQIKLEDAKIIINRLRNQVSYFQDQVNDYTIRITDMNKQITDLQNQFNSVGIDPNALAATP